LDFALYEALNGLADRHHVVADVSRFVGDHGQIAFLALLGCLFFARGTWYSRNGRHGVAAAGFSALLALGVAHVIDSLWDRPRPYEMHPGDAHLLIAPSPDPSFPSDHPTAAYALAIAILLRHRKAGMVALTLATVIAVSRVALGTHYPTDLIGGAALGGLAALTLRIAPVREPLHKLADWAGALYDRALGSLRRQKVRLESR